jgi:hypothetical protein
MKKMQSKSKVKEKKGEPNLATDGIDISEYVYEE